jgi:hypothetical protein
LSIRREHDPAPPPGLRARQFRLTGPNGFGDGLNSYAHTMVWFRDRIYTGTTRANLCMIKVFRDTNYSFLGKNWPVECPDDIYDLDRRAQIWRHDPVQGRWDRVFQAPMVMGLRGRAVARDMGYRGMTVFQGESDPEPALYVATSTPGEGPGPLILRSLDGEEFEPVSDYGILGLPITTVRTLTSFKGRLFTSPTGTRGGQVNASSVVQVFESRDPARGKWLAVSPPGFGDENNRSIFELEVFDGMLYAGTLNHRGFQVWRTAAEGNPPYRWERVLHSGAFRGPLNQAVASMQVFRDALYLGTGIQGGGYDRVHGIGPAPAELLRIDRDGHWDLVVGTARPTPDGFKAPLSLYPAGFGGFFNGYFWRMGAHDNWLYLGTYNSASLLPWLTLDEAPATVRSVLGSIGLDALLANEGGFDLWRSADGENWLPVHRQGFGNWYNFGVRTLVSTPHGLYLGTANPFGPRVAERAGDHWVYRDNPRGGLEVWRGEAVPAQT